MSFLHFNGLINYMFESTVSLGLFTFIYYFFLRKETFYGFNRAYLYISLIFSLLLPFFVFTSSKIRTINLPEIIINPNVSGSNGNGQIDFLVNSTNHYIWIYFAICISLFSIFLTRISQLYLLISQSKRKKTGQFTFVLHDHQYSPFSFFRYIFMSNVDYESSDNKPVIEHEKVHVRYWHSIDVIFLELIIIIAWFNPFNWIYRQFFKENHEFSADHKAVDVAVSWNEYARLLLGRSFGLFINDFTLSFNKLSIKKRITMMKKSKSGRLMMLKSLLAVPFITALILLFAFSSNGFSRKINSIPVAKDIMIKPMITELPTPPQDDKVYLVVKKMPEYPGGQNAMSNFLVQNIVYPEKCKKEGIDGVVYVGFIVEKNGEVKNVKVVRGANYLLDQEAMRVIKLMPKWKPGEEKEGKPVRVEYTVPIKFRLDKDMDKNKVVK